MMTTMSCHRGEQMKLHQLQALIASAETGSIRAAARSLQISQAAVTKALRGWKPASSYRCLPEPPAV